MKNRLTGKPACLAVLFSLIIVSAAEVISRILILQKAMLNLTNMGEPFLTTVISVLLILCIVKAKDRTFYIFCGAWLAWFVLNQLFTLPTMATDLVEILLRPELYGAYGILGTAFHIVTIFSILAIGALIVKYLNDGTIRNKDFNILSIVTVALILFLIILSVVSAITFKQAFLIIGAFNNLTRLLMVFLFTFFVYDSAKAQQTKTDP